MKWQSSAALLILIFLSACKEETQEPNDAFGYEFFPLEVGRVWEYQVDSILLLEQGTRIDTTSLFFREEIIEQRLNNAGDTIFVVERSERYSDTAVWQIKEVLSLARNRTQAFREEDNLRFIKMIFPIHEGDRWDGHRFFNPTIEIPVGAEQVPVFENWAYRYTLATDNTVIISMADFEDIRQWRKAEEHYEAGKGLVFRRIEVLDTFCNRCCNNDTSNPLCTSLPWLTNGNDSSIYKAEKGFIIEQRLIE